VKERAALLERVAQIDRALELEHDRKRKALTEQYERDLARLEEEASELKQAGDQQSLAFAGLRQQLAAAIARSSHQDVAHQDIDIDVALTHIDTDGDGIITRAEVKDASTGAIVLRQSALLVPAIVGCGGGVLFYLAIRWLMRRRGLRTKMAMHHARQSVDGTLPSRMERRRRVAER